MKRSLKIKKNLELRQQKFDQENNTTDKPSRHRPGSRSGRK